MNAKIGPSKQQEKHIYLEKIGREYSNSKMVNDVRRRFLEGVPEKNVTSLSLESDYDEDIYNKNPDFEACSDSKQIFFSIVQKSPDKVPVFILPATDNLTVNMNNEERAKFMNNVFSKCHDKYVEECKKIKVTPVDKKYCAATVVSGTKSMWGGHHFTAMIKPPGDDQWLNVDPTDFGGPQKFNRKQCGGYSSMIEAEAIIHYSSKTIAQATEDEQKFRVILAFWQFVDTLAFKFNTWFAGSRNEVIQNVENNKVPRGSFETTYAEMADFSAGSLARDFSNQNFIDERIHGKNLDENQTIKIEKNTNKENTEEENNDEESWVKLEN